jgi:hypothetical protein
MKKTRVRRVGALIVGLALVGAACGGDDDTVDTTAPSATEAPDSTDAPDTTDAPDPGEEVDFAGALEGMKGTTPLVPLSDEFKTRLNDFWTGKGNAELSDFNYGAESYDAVVMAALAAIAAGTDGSALGNELVNVSKDGTKCTSFVECRDLLEAGEDIDYDGISGSQDLNGNGDPLTASYGVLVFGADNRLDDSKTTFIEAAAPESLFVDQSPVGVERAGDGVLKIGSLLPETGSLAFLGPPEFAGVELAIADINEAGGVLGNPVEYSQGDSGDTSTDIASQTSDRLLDEGVDVIIGAASSAVSLTVIDKITAAGVVMISPANTSTRFSDYADNGLYFRVAPSDLLQGAVIADIIAEDGNASVYILALDDAYGTGLADVAEGVLANSGVEVLGKKIYDPKATSFDAEVAEVVAADPDAILLITFDEGSRILRTMVENGVGPRSKNVYGVDGNMGNALGENFDAGS